MRYLALLPVFFIIFGHSSHARGKDMNGKFGIGYSNSLSGAQGLGITYWTSKNLAINLLGGLEFVVDQEMDSSNVILGGLGTKFVLLSTRHANLTLGAKAIVAYSSDQYNYNASEADSHYQFAFEIPIEAEYFVSDSMSFLFSVGISGVVMGEDAILFEQTSGLGNTDKLGFTSIGIGTGGLWGFSGFVFYL